MDTFGSLSFELISRFTLGFEAFLILFIAFMTKALITHRSYHAQKSMLTESDNVASAIDLCAYLFAVLVSILDSLAIEGDSLLAQGSEVAYIGLAVIVILEMCQQLSDRLLLRGLNVKELIHTEGNLALALSRGGIVISISMMIRGVMSNPQPWIELIPWIAIGIFCIFLLGLFFQWLTPYDDLLQVKQGNMAAALPLSGAWIASGITVESAISGESVDFMSEILSVGLYLVCACVVISVVRLLLRQLFFRGVDLNKEITDDQNCGVGLIEATLYLCVAEVICFFLS